MNLEPHRKGSKFTGGKGNFISSPMATIAPL